MDRLLLAKALLTIATIGYGLITVKADFNKTHATNPLWTGHARFHVVWQITSYVGFGAMALLLIWVPGAYVMERLYLASAFAAVIYAAFFVTLFSMSLYGGRSFDENGYQAFKVGSMHWDVNVTAFAVMTMFLIAGATLVDGG